MSKLDEIAASLNVQLAAKEPKVQGTKRRSWMEQDDSKGVYKPLKEKGSINPVYKPDSLTPSINQVYKPLNEKGAINPFEKGAKLNLADLRSNPLKITLFIFERLKNTTDKVTPRTTLLEMMKTLGISKDSARTALRFLLKRELLERVAFEAGKFGWSKYRLKETLLKELQSASLKGSINPIHRPLLDKGSNSSSSYIIKTTTKDERWDFNIEPYATFGFRQSHLQQIIDHGKWEPHEVEEMLIEFAYDDANGKLPQIKKTKINFIMWLFKNNQRYVSEGYHKEQDAMIADMARKESERKKRLLQGKFMAWEKTLNETQRKQFLEILPPGNRVFYMTDGIGHPKIIEWFLENTHKPELSAFLKGFNTLPIDL